MNVAVPKIDQRREDEVRALVRDVEAEPCGEQQQRGLQQHRRHALQDLPAEEDPFRQRRHGEAAILPLLAIRHRHHADGEETGAEEVQPDQTRDEERRVVRRMRMSRALDHHRNPLRLRHARDPRLRHQERLTGGQRNDLSLREEVAVEMQPVSVAHALELRRRLPLLPPLLGLLRIERHDFEPPLLERFEERLIARRLVRRGDAHQRQRRRAAGTEDHAEAEEHQQRKGERPEHGGAIAHVEPPLDLELAPEERKRVGEGRRLSIRFTPAGCVR